MSRENLRPVLQNMPKLVLLAIVFVVGLPIHIAVGAWVGVVNGLQAWLNELSEVWKLN